MAGKGGFFTPKSKRRSSGQESGNQEKASSSNGRGKSSSNSDSTENSSHGQNGHSRREDHVCSSSSNDRKDSASSSGKRPSRGSLSSHDKKEVCNCGLRSPCKNHLKREAPSVPEKSPGKSKSCHSSAARLDLCLLSSSCDDLSDDEVSSQRGAVGGRKQITNLTSCSKLSASSEDLRLIGQDRKIDKASLKRKSRTLTFRRKKSDKVKNEVAKKNSKFWSFRLKKRLPVRLRRGKDHGLPDTAPVIDAGTCVCTGYRRTEDHTLGAGVVFAVHAAVRANVNASPLQSSASRARLSMGAGPGPTGIHAQSMLQDGTTSPVLTQVVPAPPRQSQSLAGIAMMDVGRGTGHDFALEDVDEFLKARRAHDMELGIEVSSCSTPYPSLSYPSATAMTSSITNSQSSASSSSSSAASDPLSALSLTSSFHSQCTISPPPLAMQPAVATSTAFVPPASPPASTSRFEVTDFHPKSTSSLSAYIPPTIHTQVDYIHCMVPDLLDITNCSFYWGVMDRYEAERLLESKPEGTFLLRDSAQEEFLFSVSFRRYGRSLHARIEQWNHLFSFDSHDPGVFSSITVCGLIEHYKDPGCCMFFEPMLTGPLNRTFPFSLQHMCRATACDHVTYDGINFLPLPKSLKDYLKYYHYKQKVRVRRFEMQL